MSALPIPSPEHPALSVRCRGLADYTATWREMQAFTDTRTAASPDELWLLQHPPVFTLGRNGKAEHLLHDTGDIPVIHVDRGGQVTYHGPGQLIAYLLLDLKRRRLGIQPLVQLLEQSVIDLLRYLLLRARVFPCALAVRAVSSILRCAAALVRGNQSVLPQS